MSALRAQVCHLLHIFACIKSFAFSSSEIWFGKMSLVLNTVVAHYTNMKPWWFSGAGLDTAHYLWRVHWCVPLDRFRTLTEGEQGSSSCLVRRLWLAVADVAHETPSVIGQSDPLRFFSRDCFPCGLMAPPATDWDGAGTQQWYGGSCSTTEEKKAITPQIPAGFHRTCFGCIWEKGCPGAS